jgi:hypothetical protein
MRDSDSKLIFENYKERVLVNEAIPLVAAAGVFALVAPLLSIISTKTGWTRTLMNFSKKEFGIDLDELSDSAYAPLARFLDPTGFSSWVSLQKAHEEYLKNPNDWETNAEWWSQLFGTIPLWGKLIKMISSALSGGKLGFQFLRKVLYYIGLDKKLKSLLYVGIKKYFENFQKYNPPMTGPKIKPSTEIFATLLVYLYGRGALEVLAEIRLPTLADKFIRFGIEERLNTLEDQPLSEEEIKNELGAKPSGTPAPVTAPTQTPQQQQTTDDGADLLKSFTN